MPFYVAICQRAGAVNDVGVSLLGFAMGTQVKRPGFYPKPRAQVPLGNPTQAREVVSSQGRIHLATYAKSNCELWTANMLARKLDFSRPTHSSKKHTTRRGWP